MTVVIVGAGIIGTSIAYYLSESSTTEAIHIVESCPQFFASASGYAGGFLARDWFGPASESLGELSFDLHKKLAVENNGAEQWGYHSTTTVSLSQDSRARGDDWLNSGRSRVETAPAQDVKSRKGPKWLRESRHGDIEPISVGETTAQVDPLRLCQFLLQRCRERGVQIHQPAKVEAVEQPSEGGIKSVTLSSESSSSPTIIPCSKIVLAAGAWTPRVYRSLFPDSKTRIPVSSLAGHSLVLRSRKWLAGDESSGAHAIYTTDEEGYSPEIFARAGGELYIAGVNDASIPLPNQPLERKIDRASIEKLRRTAERLLGDGETNEEVKQDFEIVREGLCFRPVTRKGTPLLGKVQEGVWTAVGHGPWGISLSLGTGLVMSEILLGKHLSADVSSLRL